MDLSSQQQSLRSLFRKVSRPQRIISIYLCVIFWAIIFFCFSAAMGRIKLSRIISPCGFKIRYNLPCPTCGITTSVLAFFKGHVLQAFYIQPAGAILCCILIILGFLTFLTAAFGIYFSFLDKLFTRLKARYIVLIILIIFGLGWLVTLARAIAEKT